LIKTDCTRQVAGFLLVKIMKEKLIFCQKPSKRFLRKLEESNGDPRSTISQHAIDKAVPNAKKGWHPTWDARDARR